MFYIKGTHFVFGNTVWLEAATHGQELIVRPTPEPLFAAAFSVEDVERVRTLHMHYYPDYHWLPVGADSDALIPENMRRTLKLA